MIKKISTKKLILELKKRILETQLDKVFGEEDGIRYSGSNQVFKKSPLKKPEQDWFIKKSNAGNLATVNEFLVYRLYRLFGIGVPSGGFLAAKDGDLYFVIKAAKGKQLAKIEELVKTDFQKGFFVDAFLANWDAVGMTPYNVFIDGEKATRIDPGGSLAYRAQGALKGKFFNDQVNELETYLGKTGLWSDGIEVWSKITPKQLKESGELFLATTENEVIETLEQVSRYVQKFGKEGIPLDSIQQAVEYINSLKPILSKRYKKIKEKIDLE
jgi:hypothetical protein